MCLAVASADTRSGKRKCRGLLRFQGSGTGGAPGGTPVPWSLDFPGWLGLPQDRES